MPFPTFEYTAIITPEHIYSKSVKIPDGYRARAFRVPTDGELYLDAFGNICRYDNLRWVNTNPRLILEKIPRKRYIFEPVEVTPDTEVAYAKSEHANSFMVCRKPYGWLKDYGQFYSLREEEF